MKGTLKQRRCGSLHDVDRVFLKDLSEYTESDSFMIQRLSKTKNATFFDRFTRWRNSDGVPTWFQVSEVVSVA